MVGIDGSINYLFREKIDELLKDSCTELASINGIVDSLSKHGLKNDIEIIVAIDSVN